MKTLSGTTVIAIDWTIVTMLGETGTNDKPYERLNNDAFMAQDAFAPCCMCMPSSCLGVARLQWLYFY